MDIEQLVKKAFKKVYFKILRSGNVSGSGGESSFKLNVTCNKCGKRGNIQKYCRSNGTISSGKPPKNFANEIPQWVTKKPVFSDIKDLATDTMTRNNNKYKWCTSYNNGNVIWGFHWKDGHDEWKHRQCKKSSVCFYNTANNAISPCSYLMTNSEYSTE